MRKTQPLDRDPNIMCADDENWRTEQRDNWRRQLRPQWVLVIVTAGAVVVAAITIGILNGTLQATKKAVDAAKVQAEAAKIQAQAALTSSQTAQKQLELSERPWVYSPDAFQIMQPLTFDDKHRGNIGIKITLRNSGNSVALNVRLRTTLVMFGELNMDKVCDPLRTKPINPVFEPSIFPGSSISVRDAGGISLTNQGEIALLMMVVCIDYKFPFSEQHHQTRYVFGLGVPEISPTDPTTALSSGGFKPIGTPPGVRLISTGGVYAD